MKFALFLGCNIPARVQEFDLSSRAVLDRLGVELTDVREFNCCGYPLRNFDYRAYLLSSARNLALAGRLGLDMITLCKCCYGSLKKADHVLKEDGILMREMNALLSGEGLSYEGNVEVRHLLSVLYHDIGPEAIRASVTSPYNGLKIAAHYGCHALRPSSIVRFDDPVSPTLFEGLVESTGAESVQWPTRLECCGAPLLGVNDDLSSDLARRKLSDCGKAGAHYMCTACPYCQLQFDRVRRITDIRPGNGNMPPPVLFTQLLGIGMGIERARLGIRAESRDIIRIEAFIT